MSDIHLLIDRKALPPVCNIIELQETVDPSFEVISLQDFIGVLFEPFTSKQLNYSLHGDRQDQMDAFDRDYNIIGRTCSPRDRFKVDDAAHHYIVDISRKSANR